MCTEAKRWKVIIEQSSVDRSKYYVRFHHVDNHTTDEFSRVFDTFEAALKFANKTYDGLK